MIRIFAVSGFKNSGKTTLCMKLLEELGRLGVRTGYIKRTAEEALSPRAADTGRAAGLGVSSALWGSDGLRIESPAVGVTPEYIVARYFPDAEIVIVEGGKYLDLPKIWVENGEPRPEEVVGVFMTYDRNSEGDGKTRFGAGCEAEMARRRGRFRARRFLPQHKNIYRRQAAAHEGLYRRFRPRKRAGNAGLAERRARHLGGRPRLYRRRSKKIAFLFAFTNISQRDFLFAVDKYFHKRYNLLPAHDRAKALLKSFKGAIQR